MAERALLRLRDMLRNIDEIERLLKGRAADDVRNDSVTKAAFERFLEIKSEVSRGVPEDWKLLAMPDSLWWRQLANIGNHIRHAYHMTDVEILWSTYSDDLPKLRTAVEAMLAEHDSRTSYAR